MSLSKSAVKRKVGGEHRQFQEKWVVQYFFVDHRGNLTCIICTEKVAVQLDMLRSTKNTTEMREPTSLPVLRHIY